MKKLFTLLIVLMLNLGCSSDSEDPVTCTPIPCLNGGTSNALCECDCPQGFTGINCGNQSTPSIIRITKIKVKAFPNTNNGSTWDISFPTAINALADIYVKLNNSIGVELYNAPNYFPNVLSDGNNSWDFIPSAPISIPFVYFNSLRLELFDYDGANSNVNNNIDDLMAITLFDIYLPNNGFPTTITIGNTTTPIIYDLSLQYVW